MWAPNAKAVSVVGDFNGWDKEKAPMKRVGEIGVYETFVPGVKPEISISSALRRETEENFTRRIPMR